LGKLDRKTSRKTLDEKAKDQVKYLLLISVQLQQKPLEAEDTGC
jgi:hypothetical protein